MEVRHMALMETAATSTASTTATPYYCDFCDDHFAEQHLFHLRRPSSRGFAGMAVDKRRAIAARGGRAAHAMGTAHQFTSAEAKAAGRIGGALVSRDREHMATIGRKGGEAKAARPNEAT